MGVQLYCLGQREHARRRMHFGQGTAGAASWWRPVALAGWRLCGSESRRSLLGTQTRHGDRSPMRDRYHPRAICAAEHRACVCVCGERGTSCPRARHARPPLGRVEPQTEWRAGAASAEGFSWRARPLSGKTRHEAGAQFGSVTAGPPRVCSAARVLAVLGRQAEKKAQVEGDT